MSVRDADELIGAGGVRLSTWSLRPPSPRAVVILVHGLGEHSDRYAAVAQRLVSEGYAVWALDHRGHGRSAGARERFRLADVVADLGSFVERVAAAEPDLERVMLGHSFGGLVAATYAAGHGDRLTGLVLSGALAAIDAPPVVQRAGRLVARVAPGMPLIALDATLTCRDPAVVAAYRADPLVHHGRIPAASAVQLVEGVAALPELAARITLPTLILYGTADGLCPPAGSVMLADRIGSGDVTVRAYDGLYHEVLNEPERDTVLGDVLGWLDARLPGAAPASASA